MKRNSTAHFATSMTKALLALVAIMPFAAARAEERPEPEDGLLRSVAGISAGLSAYGSDSGYNIEAFYTWFPLRYVGMGCGVELFKGITDNDVGTMFDVDGRHYTIEEGDADVRRIALTPHLSVRTPMIWFRGHKRGLFVESSPGLVLSWPNNNTVTAWYLENQHDKVEHSLRCHNTGGRAVYWRVRNALTYKEGHAQLSLGYTISNFGMFDNRRTININGRRLYDDAQKRFTHTVFVSAAYTF